MSRWWRAHDDAVDNPKLCLLSDRAHRGWFNLMCVASANGGTLPGMDVLHVKLRLPVKKIEAIIAELRERRLLDEVDGVLRPHDWDGRQFKSDVTDGTNAARQKRYRDRHRNAKNNAVTPVTVTATRVQSTETEKKDAADAAPSVDPEKDLFRRGKEVAGKDAGGLIARLLKAKKNNVSLARAAVETAATKQNPREYIGAVIAGGHASADGKRLTNDEQFFGVGRLPGVV